MSRAESPEQRAERILTELREATSEAAGVLRDLLRAGRTAREQVDDYLGKGVQDALNHYKTEVETVAQHYAAEARKDVESFSTKAIKRATTSIDNAVAVEAAAEVLAARIARLIKTKDGASVLDFGVGTDMELPDVS